MDVVESVGYLIHSVSSEGVRTEQNEVVMNEKQRYSLLKSVTLHFDTKEKGVIVIVIDCKIVYKSCINYF